MSKQFETGHAKNVANLLRYNQFVTTLGVAYNPPLQTISMAALDALYLNAKARLDAVTSAEEAWKTSTNNREIRFNTLSNFATRVLGMLRSTGAPQQTVNDLKALVDKVRGTGKRTTPVVKDAPAAAVGDDPASQPLTRSTSHQSFDQRLENFNKMIVLLQGVLGYSPSEQDLATDGLITLYAEMTGLNNNANTADTNLKNARASRNTFFYAPETGVLDLVKKSKDYIMSLYGRSSSQYNTALTFKLVKTLQ